MSPQNSSGEADLFHDPTGMILRGSVLAINNFELGHDLTFWLSRFYLTRILWKNRNIAKTNHRKIFFTRTPCPVLINELAIFFYSWGTSSVSRSLIGTTVLPAPACLHVRSVPGQPTGYRCRNVPVKTILATYDCHVVLCYLCDCLYVPGTLRHVPVRLALLFVRDSPAQQLLLSAVIDLRSGTYYYCI